MKLLQLLYLVSGHHEIVELKQNDAQSKHVRLFITIFPFELFRAHVQKSPSLHAAFRVAIR